MRFLLTTIILVLGYAAAAQNTLTVISNAKGSPPELKLAELKSILLGERQRWRNGNKIMIGLMKTTTPVGKMVSERLYNMSPDDVRKYWLALVFQGKADAPVFFNNTGELQAFVAENPGAIGVVDQPVPGHNNTVVLVDGKRAF